MSYRIVQERYLPIIRGARTPFPCAPRHFNHSAWDDETDSRTVALLSAPYRRAIVTATDSSNLVMWLRVSGKIIAFSGTCPPSKTIPPEVAEGPKLYRFAVIWAIHLYVWTLSAFSAHRQLSVLCRLIAKFHYTDPTRTGHGQSPRTLSSTS